MAASAAYCHQSKRKEGCQPGGAGAGRNRARKVRTAILYERNLELTVCLSNSRIWIMVTLSLIHCTNLSYYWLFVVYIVIDWQVSVSPVWQFRSRKQHVSASSPAVRVSSCTWRSRASKAKCCNFWRCSGQISHQQVRDVTLIIILANQYMYIFAMSAVMSRYVFDKYYIGVFVSDITWMTSTLFRNNCHKTRVKQLADVMTPQQPPMTTRTAFN